jgi:signal transduction histidine kinase
MKEALHIVHIEDSPNDGEMIHRALKADGLQCTIVRVETQEQLLEALRCSNPDLILSDCSLPQFRGWEALQIARISRPSTPFIFVSGTIGEDSAIDSLQRGATDYVLKHRLSRLVPAVRRALIEAENRRERCELEDQLLQARRFEAVGTLLGGLAHDFRNLLQIQKLSIDLLAMSANEPDQVLEIATELDKATARGCAMIQELLAFSRKGGANLQPIDMAAQINESARLLQNSLPEGVTLTLGIEEDLPPILADGVQVDRMVTNLIINARDAMPEGGGEIVVAIDLVRFAGISLDAGPATNAHYLRVSVSDNGIGIAPETQARIFEPFFTTKPNGKGTGLGLSTVLSSMSAHHGLIDLESKVGEGTCFSLFFPLSQGSKVAQDRLQIISPRRLCGKPALSPLARTGTLTTAGGQSN